MNETYKSATPNADYDAVIVGAGPAGASTAIRLARHGFRVALLDKKRFPRPKPCGEFMSPACLPLLDELGVGEAVRGLGAHQVRGMLLSGFGKRASGCYGPLGRVSPDFAHGLAVRRDAFDLVLLRAAAATDGVDLYEGWAVDELLREPSGSVTGVVARHPSGEEAELRAPFTVGADGIRSRVAEALGARRPIPWLQKFALVTRYRGIPDSDHAELHFFPGGYLIGCSVDSELFSLNLIVEHRTIKASGMGAEEFFETRVQRCPRLAERLSAGSRTEPIKGTGPLAATTTRQTFDGAALVGDACGHVDPVTGEGIFFALRGSAALADSVASALHARRRDRAALRDYMRVRRKEILPRLRLGRLLQRGLRCPSVVRGLLHVLQARPHLADRLVSLTGDYAPLSELVRPSTWLR